MINIPVEERLIIAADFEPRPDSATPVHDVAQNLAELAQELKGLGVVIKINSVLRAIGYNLINTIHSLGLKVFADLKLYDIPNTMATDAKFLGPFQPDFLTVMCCANIKGMAAVQDLLPKTEVLGVTVLTTFDREECFDVFVCDPPAGTVRFAKRAKKANLRGLILSPQEAAFVKDLPELEGLLTLNTPGIRYPWSEMKDDDQVRTASAGASIKRGVHRVVVGRPVLNAGKFEHPDAPKTRREAVELILEDIRNALEPATETVAS